jgi:hypothetical protein
MRATIETSASTAVAVMVVVIATSAASATNEVGAVGSASAASAENTASASSAAGKAKALGGADVDAARFPANKPTIGLGTETRMCLLVAWIYVTSCLDPR